MKNHLSYPLLLCGLALVVPTKVHAAHPPSSPGKAREAAVFQIDDFRQIRETAVAFYRRSTQEGREQFIMELENGAFLVGGDTVRQGAFRGQFRQPEAGRPDDPGEVVLIAGKVMAIGGWRIERDRQGYILIRYGNHQESMAFDFGLRLKRTPQGWIATESFSVHHHNVRQLP